MWRWNRAIATALSLVVVGTTLAAEEFVVTFRMESPDLPEHSIVYIAGSVAGLGNWRPDQVQMEYEGDHVWSFRLPIEEKQTIEYKYTLGSWQREGADADRRPLENLTVTLDHSMVKDDRIDFWTKQLPRKIVGQITGQVVYHRQLAADGLRPRDVIVWLPPRYDCSPNTRYPVLYMHDGQNIIDPQTSAFGVDWQIDETCTQLICAGQLAPLIVVGVYNTPDRSREYLPGPKGTAYRKFVVESLKPLIDQEYRTNPARTHTYTGGSSAGGLCAFMLAWEHPEVFSKALCLSPAFKYRNPKGTMKLDYVTAVHENERPDARVFFYLDNGGLGLEQKLQPGIDDMLAALKDKGLQPHRDFHWQQAPNDEHSESAWAKRFPQAIRILTSANGALPSN